MSAEIEILIPHHRGPRLLRETLDALGNQTLRPDVCVIDNGSADGSIEMLAGEYPQVRVVALGRNRGFGAALNAGAKTSEARTLGFLNDDAVPDRRFVEELLACAERSGAEAVAGCLVLAERTIDTAGVQVDRSLVAYDHLHGQPFPPGDDVAPPLGPCGGAAAFARSTFLDLGGFDEGFFAYLEDVDLAIRLRLAGMRCEIAPGAFAWHRHAGTLGAGSREKNRLLGRGRGRLLWKYGRGLPPAARLRGFVIDGATYLGQLAVDRNAAAVLGRLEERRSHRGAPSPAAALGGLPLLDVGLAESLRRRWARGRRYRADGP